MRKHHPAAERMHSRIGWLDSRHTFSFADHYDPKRMGFRALRVINDDRVQPGEGFGTHPHREMEIITLVLEGALAHKDSMGKAAVLKAGEMQRMSAGTGLHHSEYNASEKEPVHFLQIWVLPEKKGVEPSHQEAKFSLSERRGRLRPLVSRDAREGSLSVNQDMVLYGSVLEDKETVELSLAPGRHAFVHVAKGSVMLDGQRLEAGDGMEISGEEALRLEGSGSGEVLVFDLA